MFFFFFLFDFILQVCRNKMLLNQFAGGNALRHFFAVFCLKTHMDFKYIYFTYLFSNLTVFSI